MGQLRFLKALAFCATAFAVPSANAGEIQTAPSTVQVYAPIQFAVLLEMDFGTVVSNSAGGTIHLDTSDGTRDCAGGSLTCIGAFNFARLELSGTDANVRISYDSSLELIGPGAPITVEPEFVGGQDAVVQLTGGNAVFDFGAKLHVNPGQKPGEYSGTFTVDVSYE
jgi:type 1 fimbria pilin